MTTVYRKSAKGQLEVETRANRLVPRLRTALILVDGRRNDAELRALVQVEPDATLLALLEGGYIEVAAATPGAPASAEALHAVPAQQAAPVAVGAPAPAGAAAGAGGMAFADWRRLAVRHLTDQLGPAAETAAMRIEKARNWDELRPALEHGHRVLLAARGGAAAAQFAARFIDPPPG